MPRNTLVRELMSIDVLTFSPDEAVAAAMERLVERGIDAGPVVDAEGRVIGLLSTADLIVQESRLHAPTVISILSGYIELPGSARRFEEDLRKSLGSTVRDVMQPDPVVCRDDDTLEDAATLMHEHDVSRLPVLRDGELVGILARGDIVRALVRERG